MGSPTEQRDLLDTCCERFLADWQRGATPKIEDFLREVPSTQRRHALNRLTQIDLESRWQAAVSGRLVPVSQISPRPQLEEYVSAFPELGPLPDLPIELIVAEFRVRWICGDRPSLNVFRQRFSSRETEVEAALQVLLRELATDSTDEFWPSSRQPNATPPVGTTFVPGLSSSSVNESSQASLHQSHAALAVGDSINGYFLLEKLGEGGCGVVFKATHHTAPQAKFAIKFVRPDRLAKRKVAARFEQEVSIARKLSHPNIVGAPDSGNWQGISYLVMELVEGEPVDQLIHKQPNLALADACEIIRQAAFGMQHIHEAGYVHRDVKPSNLILAPSGLIKIVDFGMAGLKDPIAEGERLTSLGDAMGTPDYMAPEQWINSRAVGIQADIYSLGCTLFCLLIGKPPFDDGTHLSAISKMHAHQGVKFPDPKSKRPDLPDNLIAILKRCVEKDPKQRYASPNELAWALAPFCASSDLSALAAYAAHADEVTQLPATEKPTGTFPVPVRPFTPPTQADDPSGTQIQPPSSSQPESAETWIPRRDELEGTHSEETIVPQASRGSSISQSITASFGSVTLRQREITQGIRQGSDTAEYELGERLGEGGMGAVYQARQGAIDRTVALKVIKPGLRNADSLKEKFVAEAVITGDLEHPGIVPIYDLGTNSTGEVFYAMKEVRGQSWKETIDKVCEAENVEVLLRVADAIAFAHARGIVHRDLKPDNVMIGEFGEVLVMDWGLALPTPKFSKQGIAFARGAAGTPAYMAPEMASGDMDLIGPASDIYLLGALLFRVLTGKAPHGGKHAFACLQAAERNEIVKVDRDDEFLTIAMRAMAMHPQDRYPTVKDFQNAIRDYRSHAESIRLADYAEAELEAALASQLYPGFTRAIAAYEDALRLWDANARAKSGLRTAQTAYAKTAFERGDFDLAAQQLDPLDSEHAEILERVRVAKAERDSRLQRIQRLKQVAVGLAGVVCLAALLLYKSWRQEQAAHAEALLRFQQAQQAIDRISGVSRDLKDFPRLQGVRKNMLEMVASYYAELNESRSSDPDLQLARAAAMLKLGDVHVSLGEPKTAVKSFGSAIEWANPLAQQTSRPDVKHEALLLLVKSYLKQAQSLLGQRQLDAADAALSAALKYESDSPKPDFKAAQGDVWLARARLQRERGDSAEALKSVSIAQELLKSASEHASEGLRKECRVSLATSFDQLAFVHEHAGDLDAAMLSVKQAIAIWDDLHTGDPDIPTYLEGLATSHVLLGNFQRSSGRDAELAARGSIKSYAALVQARPEVPRYQFNLATEQANLGYILLQVGKLTDAKTSALEAVRGFVRLANEYPEEIDFADSEASARSVLGEALRDLGEFDLASSMFDEAIQHFKARVSDFQDVPQYRERLAENLSLQAQVSLSRGDAAKSTDLLKNALRELELIPESQRSGSHHGDLAAWIHLHLADDAWARLEQAQAESHYQTALKLREALPVSPQLQDHLGWLLSSGLSPQSRDPKRAVTALKAATQAVPGNATFWFDLAFAQTQAGDWDQVAASLAAAQKASPPAFGQLELIQSLVERHQGHAAKADELLKRGGELLVAGSPGNPRLLRLQHLATPPQSAGQ